MKTVGYKAMLSDMTCRGYQFELGKTYTIDNDKPLKLCTDSGFHFCLDLEDVFKFYHYSSRIFEVETESEVVTDSDKSITKTLTIKRELTREELANHQFESNVYNIYFKDYTDKELLKLNEDNNVDIRLLIAHKMKDLDLMFKTFKDDECWIVREVVVKRMEDLDLMFETFKNDENSVVRKAVIEKKTDLDLMFKTFKDDEVYKVR